ncbi:MAG: helix-turn-helix domain-containing protein, partial [Actinomycetota bacterium]
MCRYLAERSFTPRGRSSASPHEVERVLRLVAEGRNDCQISRETGINRTTIREWRRNGPP